LAQSRRVIFAASLAGSLAWAGHAIGAQGTRYAKHRLETTENTMRFLSKLTLAAMSWIILPSFI
jgi:hypothetical protein